MKKIGYYIIGLFILTGLSCENKNDNNLKNPQKNKKITSITINNNTSVDSTNDISKLISKNKNFDNLFRSLQKKTFSVEELIDIVKQDLNYIKEIRQSPKNKRIDTATVKSRLLLTEINLKKMQFLLHKKPPQKDTIEKTLKAIINNMNSTINQIRIYNYNFDEFSEILAIDSIQKAKHDSLQKLLQKHTKPNIKNIDLKLKKLF